MTGNEVRKRFLNYFQEKSHRVLPSSSLIPTMDPTLLFTNAGMVQFKGVFLGQESVGTKRAATSQKCLRVSGKHNDLENVGYTARHHTFFEMLGNFSFGDYFKKEAILLGWDFLVNDLNISPERLFASVFREDDDAFEIWKDEIGLSEDRIFRFDEEDNFWAMGDTGPCGPCSEIMYDQGEEAGCGRPECTVGCDCDRYLEIWNLVFMQFNRDKSGALAPLPSPSIDTGMGLERLTAVIQGVKSNYDTDFFSSIIANIAQISGIDYGSDEKLDAAMRVISDHSRATTFLIADGVLPSNAGRGYVLRRIMRRALRHGKKLGFHDPFLHRVAEVVIDEMGGHYLELETGRDFIKKVVLNEEERFLSTLDSGLRIFNDEASRLREVEGKVFPGNIAFKLYDTYGFPVDLTEDICRERGMTVDMEGFESNMEEQRERARKAWKGGEYSSSAAAYSDLLEEGFAVEFTGYANKKDKGNIVALVKEGERITQAKVGEEVDMVIDRTPFYGESGGQVGDRGTILNESFKGRVEDTLKVGTGITILRCSVESGEIAIGDEVEMIVEERAREYTEANHTATHILHAGLRSILGDHVRQAGSYVGPDKLRFDYTHFDQVNHENKIEIEEFVNGVIFENKDVSWELVPYERALEQGAMALFGEKYGDLVRMVKVEGISTELCGGTHVDNSRDVGIFAIVDERALASGVRRIEALTGPQALEFLNKSRYELESAAHLLTVSTDKVADRLARLMEEVKRLEKEKDDIKKKAMKGELLGGDLSVEEISGIPFAHRILMDVDVKTSREMIDELKNKLKSGVILLGTKSEGKHTILVGVTKDLEERLDARQIVSAISKSIGGKGGGRATLAQTGSSDAGSIERAIKSTRKFLNDL